jgi:hypothetical protein
MAISGEEPHSWQCISILVPTTTSYYLWLNDLSAKNIFMELRALQLFLKNKLLTNKAIEDYGLYHFTLINLTVERKLRGHIIILGCNQAPLSKD